MEENMNIQQKFVVVILDILLITEVCISMYLANQTPDMLTPVFIKTFFIMCIPTLILAKIAVNRLRTKPVETEA